MRGMILAAGRGQRMGYLTEEIPKPLLKVAGKYLIEYAIEAFVRANIREIVINVSWLAELIQQQLGDGEKYNAHFMYSYEPTALETGGGIVQALPLLGEDPFIVMSADIVTNYPLNHLTKRQPEYAHLVLVNNPDFHPAGDFSLENGYVKKASHNPLTYANIGLYHPDFFSNAPVGKFLLGDLIRAHLSLHQVTGEIYSGRWLNIGTPQDLQMTGGHFEDHLDVAQR
ncbi:MAG: nucleotidyltransferase family protein [Gammaproteobacteria bacterium]|nr:nucleotidyltransferase family protein [Gammaproteobacteria bacterium]